MERYKRKFEEDNDETVEQIASTIDLTPLENEVKKRIGVAVQLSIEVKKSRKAYLSVKSNDLTKYTGIFKNVYDKCILETFNSSINTEEPTWWMTFNFSFEYKSGGSNGTQLLTSWYNYETKKWDFK